MTNPLDTAAATDAERLDPRVDLAVAIVFFLVGAAIFFQAWNMPTFRERGGDIFTAPGIVPGFHGLVIAFLAALLGARAVVRKRRGLGATSRESTTAGLAGLALVIVLCLAFAVGMVTRLPFWLASAIFVTAFIVIFEWRSGKSPARLVATALVVGVGAGVAIAYVFEKLFLVRLP
jgi:hypothetical protein